MLSYYFYAANKVSESFVSLAVRMLLLYRKIFLMAFLNFDYNCLDFGHAQGLQFLKKGLGLFHFFRLKLRIR